MIGDCQDQVSPTMTPSYQGAMIPQCMSEG